MYGNFIEIGCLQPRNLLVRPCTFHLPSLSHLKQGLWCKCFGWNEEGSTGEWVLLQFEGWFSSQWIMQTPHTQSEVYNGLCKLLTHYQKCTMDYANSSHAIRSVSILMKILWKSHNNLNYSINFVVAYLDFFFHFARYPLLLRPPQKKKLRMIIGEFWAVFEEI